MNEQEKELIQDYKNLIQDYKLLTKDLRMLLSSVLGEEKEEENCNFVTLLKQPEKDVNSLKFERIKKGVRQKPKYGDNYCYLKDNGQIGHDVWADLESDIFRFNSGNIFNTEEKTEDFKKNTLTKQQLKDLAFELNYGVEIDWKNDRQPKHYLYIDHDINLLTTEYAVTVQENIVYCLNNQFLEIAKERIGEEKLIKLIKSGV